MEGTSSCIFCRIAAGEIPAQVLHETPEIIVFRDISPKAPVHCLAIPRRHATSLGEFAGLEAALMAAVRETAKKLGIDASGFRVVLNQGADAGQEVPHIHFHVLGGRKLGWPPG